MNKCLICEAEYQSFVDFGEMPIANAFAKKEDLVDEYKFPMKMGFCKSCKMVQLAEQPERERMFHENYAFFSSTSNYMKEHFKKFANSVCELQELNERSFVLEIGSNDGIMMQNFVNRNIPCLGIEPSKNVAKVAREKGIEVLTEFFDLKLAENIITKYQKADAILSANVMCHIPYMHSIYDGVKALLKDNGVFIFEDPYLGEVIEKTSFDQIYDEHVFLFSALSVSHLASMHGLELIDTEFQITHGGSMRYTLAHKGAKKVSNNVITRIKNEMELGLHTPEAYSNFSDNVDKIRDDLISLLIELKNKGKRVVAYGATSKSTTVANYFGITPDLVECIYDTTPIKQNKLSPGAHIPVLPYDQFRQSDPDYVLLFAWNHATEIMKKEKEYMANNKHWITYIPKVEVS
ncbi:MAG: class I SAM-dependent methyltransferase [Methylophilaceae bacterium]|jgi:methylation protein EvaC|nr:class I SAM-dependent methyltransferase [Methylophilaceae bacterium]